jgi:acyl-CoA thioester hydrolase
MHPFHRYTFAIPPEAIDRNGHVNNVEFVRWMQDAAVDHAQAVGCTAATKAAGCTWVVRSHAIDYLRPAFAGEPIEVRTWIADYRRAFSTRKYEFHRLTDSVLLARGETNWVYVDATTGRPKSIPAQIQALFVVADSSKAD